MYNDDDSAITYVILGTHLCHATVSRNGIQQTTKDDPYAVSLLIQRAPYSCLLRRICSTSS